jgi:hypothetical protein
MITLRPSANKPPQPKSEAPAMKKPNDPEAIRRARVRQLISRFSAKVTNGTAIPTSEEGNVARFTSRIEFGE